MNESALFLGILPLIVFVVVDSFASMKMALISAAVFALIEVIASFAMFGEMDELSVFSLILVALMGFYAYKKDNEKYFLFQPVVISTITGVYLLGTYFFTEPVLKVLMVKYAHLYPPQMQALARHPLYLAKLETATLSLGLGMLAHAAVTAWAALKLGKWWWLALRGIGFYLFMFLSMVVAGLI